jgi:hypothetical protein
MNGRLYIALIAFLVSINALQASEFVRFLSRSNPTTRTTRPQVRYYAVENTVPFIAPQMPKREDKHLFYHIFSGNPGHFRFSPDNYDKLAVLVNNPSNYKGKDRYGKDWFFHGNMWAYAKNGTVVSGGMSNIPNDYGRAKKAGLRIDE